MTSWQPYLWKDYRQNRRLALVALGASLGFTFIPSLLYSLVSGNEWDGGYSLGTLFLGGPLLALIAGVYAMGRERGTVETFWRSQPLEMNRWLISKYLVGLTIVWLACWVPIWIDAFTRPLQALYGINSDEMAESIVYSFILLLIYSVSFVLGACIRGILHAAILAAGAMALIYLVPMVVAPLSWLSIEVVQKADVGALDAPSFFAFAAGMVVPSVLLLWLASVLLKRNIQLEVDRRTLSWSVIILLLVFAAGIAFPMGTNLSAQQVISLPINNQDFVWDMAADGNDILCLVADGSMDEDLAEHTDNLIRIHIDREDSFVDSLAWISSRDIDPNSSLGIYDIAWSTENPSLVYAFTRKWSQQGTIAKEDTDFLYVIALDAQEEARIIRRIDLNALIDGVIRMPKLCLCEQRLFLYDGPEGGILVFSLADPQAPVLMTNEELEDRIGFDGPGLHDGAPKEYQVRLIPSEGMDLSDRLKVTRQFSYYNWWPVGDNQVLASLADRSGVGMQLVLFEIGSVEDNVVALRPVTRRRIPVLESVLGRSYGELCCSGSLAFLNSYDSVTVYDISRPGRIERIGHYAAGEQFSTLLPLPDNRVVIVGKKLYVLDLSKKVK